MKSRILNPKRMKQLIDFKGIELDGGIYPTDIDGIIEYRDSEYIILEVKHSKAKVPWGNGSASSEWWMTSPKQVKRRSLLCANTRWTTLTNPS